MTDDPTEMPLWAKIVTRTMIVIAAIILAGFFYQPTLDIYWEWAGYVMGVKQ